MVAFSFKQRFVEPIRAGRKRQTIRLPRKRNPRPGEALQIYTAMRTRYCEKIIRDPTCASVEIVRLQFWPAFRTYGEQELVIGDAVLEGKDEKDAFAQSDGFKDLHDMIKFWRQEHGAGNAPINFTGILIAW